jgi:GTP-binding protein
MESLRREGYEFQIRKPEVIEINDNGVIKEPLEELTISVPTEYTGAISEIVNQHKGTLVDMQQLEETTTFIYTILTRNLIGIRYKIITATKGSAIVSNTFKEYVPKIGSELKNLKGSLISTNTGTALAYALNTIQNRGPLFITPGTEVYEGMIIGKNSRENDIEVNPCKGRHKTGVRMSHSEITQIILKPPILLNLDNALSFIGKDDMLEITPQNIRLRKIYLKAIERVKQKRQERKLS